MECRLAEKQDAKIRHCVVCGKEFQVSYPSHKTQTCSDTCAFELRTKGHYQNCEICGKQMWVMPCFDGKQRFCSRECLGIWHSKTFIGENHPNWQGGTSNFPYPFGWNEELKQQIKERDNFVCRKCGSEENLTVHHIDYNKDNLDPSNLITLCNTCNVKANYGREYWKEFYVNIMEVQYA
jgi:predicted nucleic acid-binding Zn ribbon protein